MSSPAGETFVPGGYMAEVTHVVCKCTTVHVEEEQEDAPKQEERESELPDWGKAALVIGAALLFGVAA